MDEFEGLDEAYEEMEKARHDAMTKSAIVRTVVVKHVPGTEWYNKEKSTTILHSQIFELGLTSKGENHCHNWLDEEWDTHGNNSVEWILKDKPNGLYEIVGDFYYHGWVSGYYEREYESDGELRDFKIQEITFDHMSRLVDEEKLKEDEIELTKLVDPSADHMNWDTFIHPYMSKKQIMNHFANALCSIMRGYWDNRTDTKNMTVDELDVFIHMCMLEIDSNSEKDQKSRMLNNLAQKMDEAVKKTIDEHEALFNAKG